MILKTMVKIQSPRERKLRIAMIKREQRNPRNNVSITSNYNGEFTYEIAQLDKNKEIKHTQW